MKIIKYLLLWLLIALVLVLVAAIVAGLAVNSGLLACIAYLAVVFPSKNPFIPS